MGFRLPALLYKYIRFFVLVAGYQAVFAYAAAVDDRAIVNVVFLFRLESAVDLMHGLFLCICIFDFPRLVPVELYVCITALFR